MEVIRCFPGSLLRRLPQLIYCDINAKTSWHGKLTLGTEQPDVETRLVVRIALVRELWRCAHESAVAASKLAQDAHG